MMRLGPIVCSAVLSLAFSTTLLAQTTQTTKRPTPPTVDDRVDPAPVPDSHELYMLRPGHYVLPAPYSPAYFSPHVRPFPDYSEASRRYGGRSNLGASRFGPREGGNWAAAPGYYGPIAPGTCGSAGYGAYGGYGYGGYDAAAAYEQGRYDADHDYLWYIASARAGRLLNQYSDQFDKGILKFRDGRYDQALIQLLGAAEKNHASGACRLHAGHALFALGRFQDAVRLISRAFELSPSLPFKDYDIRDEYGHKGDFDRQLAALQRYVDQRPNDVAGLTMLGYVTFYSEGPGASYPALRRAHELSPEDMFIPKLYEIARMTQSIGDIDGVSTASDPSSLRSHDESRSSGTEIDLRRHESPTAPDLRPGRVPMPDRRETDNPIRRVSYHAVHE